MSVMPEVAAQGRQEMMQQGANIAGMFVGPNAKLPAEARAAYQQAQEMEKDLGKMISTPTGGFEPITPEVIRQRTGWDKNSAGQWRMEISDQGSKMLPAWQNVGPGQTVKTGDVFHHPELYQLYPHLQDMPLRQMTSPGEGAFHSDFGIGVGYGGSGDLERSVALHELQHGVSGAEGWPRGAGLQSPEVVAYATAKTQPLYDKGLLNPDQALKFYDAQRMKGYMKEAGEVDSRNTEARRDMSMHMRNLVSPLKTQDVKPEDVIQPFTGPVLPGYAARATPAYSIPTDPVAAAKAQLAPYQHPVFDRLYASTKDIAHSLAKTKSLTDLMRPPSVMDLIGGGR